MGPENWNDEIDEGVEPIYYVDLDLDGYGSSDTGIPSCIEIPNRVTRGNDCNDSDPNIHPGIVESPCAVEDQNCDQVVGDEALCAEAGRLRFGNAWGCSAVDPCCIKKDRFSFRSIVLSSLSIGLVLLVSVRVRRRR